MIAESGINDKMSNIGQRRVALLPQTLLIHGCGASMAGLFLDAGLREEIAQVG